MWFLYQQITRCTKRALWSQRNGKDKASPPFLPGVCLLTLIPSKTPLLFVFLLRMLRSSPDLGLPPVSIGILECAHWWLLTSRQTSGSVNTANPLHHRSLSTTVSSSLRVNTKTRERTDDRMEESATPTASEWNHDSVTRSSMPVECETLVALNCFPLPWLNDKWSVSADLGRSGCGSFSLSTNTLFRYSAESLPWQRKNHLLFKKHPLLYICTESKTLLLRHGQMF